MIHHLLHARLGGGGSSPHLISPPNWHGLTYESYDYVEDGTSVSAAIFTVKSDGTFVFSGALGVSGGSWRIVVGAGVGGGYEVRFTVIETFGSGSNTNGASSFVSLSDDRAFALTVTRAIFGAAFGRRKVLVELRPVGGSVSASGWFIAEATAEVGFGGGGGGGGV